MCYCVSSVNWVLRINACIAICSVVSKIYAHLERTLSVFNNQSLPAGVHHRKIPLTQMAKCTVYMVDF